MLSPVSTPADDIARRHYEDRQLLAARAAVAARRAWRSIDADNIASSWAGSVPALVTTIGSAQQVAAAAADGFVDDALAAGDGVIDADAVVEPRSFARIASDGRPLNTLLTQPAISTLSAIAVGADVDDALDIGLGALTRIVVTQVADAGRVADGVAILTRPNVGYVRMLAPPSCSRCAVLAGRRYRAGTAFQRHPRCDCLHIPVAESMAGDITVDARRYFDSLTRTEQERIFTEPGARAIREGADIGQVVNARRGMTAAGTTSEGTSRRGFAGRRLGGRRRLMPERIFAEADGDRDLALSLLREHGFIA